MFSTFLQHQQQERIIWTLWFIWKARNEHRFHRRDWTINQVIQQVTNEMTGPHLQETRPATDTNLQNAMCTQLTNCAGPGSHEHAPPNAAPSISPQQLFNSAGPRCFVDAAIQPVTTRYLTRRAGLGIFILHPHAAIQHGILIQAEAQADDALQAEAQAPCSGIRRDQQAQHGEHCLPVGQSTTDYYRTQQRRPNSSISGLQDQTTSITYYHRQQKQRSALHQDPKNAQLSSP